MPANIPTSGNQIIVDATGMGEEVKPSISGNELTGWLLAKSTSWEAFRDRGYQARWAEYWRIWRGMWQSEDRNRASERSRLIAPALAQAIEMTVAEIEEGLFSKDVWFDVPDDVMDPERADVLAARDLLRDDFDVANIKDNLSEAILVGAIYGTGIVKINVEVLGLPKLQAHPKTGRMEAVDVDEVVVSVESIRPDEFIPDPAGRNIQEMLGCFHKVQKPLHAIVEKIEAGIYRKDALASLSGQISLSGNNTQIDSQDPQTTISATESDMVELLEYHGKVPANMLNDLLENKTEIDRALASQNSEEKRSTDGPMVEAIITIANGSTLLRAMVNPFTMKDRSIVAFQFEKVPGRFWGRGVAEKGYNPQKALDAELRSRIDALGFISSPMIGIDSGRTPRGFKMEVKPGKVWLTQGPPREIIQPVEIGALQQATFGQTDAMERMVQMGTGAFDTASALGGGVGGNAQAGNTSLMLGAFVKRAKRAIRSVNDNLLTPVIKKAMWRYMQFAPNKYPQDYQFVVKPTLGIVAREVEAMQLTQLMGMMPEEHPQVTVAIAKGILELSSLHNKGQVMAALEEAMKPPSKEETEKKEALDAVEFEASKASAEAVMQENQKTLAEVQLLMAQTEVAKASIQLQAEKVRQDTIRIQIQNGELEELNRQNDIGMMRLDLQERQLEQKTAEAAKSK